MLKHYSNTAVEATLVAGIDDTVGSCQVSSTTGFPTLTPFTITIDPDSLTEEVCLVTLVVGTTLNITRGYDGTTALSHTAGAIVKHSAVAEDFREANEHTFGTAAHGTTTPIVGEDDTQTLRNKTISGLDNAITDIDMDNIAGLDDALNLKADLASPTFTGTVTLPSSTSVGDVSAAEIGYLDGTTSNIQDQLDALDAELDAKAPLASPTFTGNVTLPSTTQIGTVSAAEIAALDGVLTNLQAQISAITGGGVAVPPGGATDEILVKLSGADYDMAWRPLSYLAYVPGGGGGNYVVTDGAITGSDATGTYTSGTFTWRWHKFTSTGTTLQLSVSQAVIGEILIVGAGGGGGNGTVIDNGGGGGAGSVYTGAYAFGTGLHNCTIGLGGAATVAGGDTRFDDIICYGGGRGGNGGISGGAGTSGGSGGGGGSVYGAGGTKTGGSLDAGATSLTAPFGCTDGASGGIGGGGNGGGAALLSSLDNSAVTYAQGGSGGGGAAGSTPGSGGSGGSSNGAGGAGANGIVIVRYRIA